MLEFLYPKAPRTIKEVTPEKKFMLRVKTEWGNEQRQEKYIDIKLVGEQSRVMERLVRRSLYNTHFEKKDWEKEERRSLFSPVAQYEQTKRFGMLDQYKVYSLHSLSRYFNDVCRSTSTTRECRLSSRTSPRRSSTSSSTTTTGRLR